MSLAPLPHPGPLHPDLYTDAVCTRLCLGPTGFATGMVMGPRDKGSRMEPRAAELGRGGRGCRSRKRPGCTYFRR